MFNREITRQAAYDDCAKLRLRRLLMLAALLLLVVVPFNANGNALGNSKTGLSSYDVTILPSLGRTTVSQAVGLNNRGWIAGISYLDSNNTMQRATLWTLAPQRLIDLGTLGGPNSNTELFHDERGLIAGYSDTSNQDPFGEGFCGSASGDMCLAFRWSQGKGLIPLSPFAGGNNSDGFDVNDSGQVAGTAENGTHDPSCPSPQVLDFEAVVWEPNTNHLKELPPLPGDTVGYAGAINDSGAAVGSSSGCAPTTPAHAVLWQNGKAIQLPTLGGTTLNEPSVITETGVVVGDSELSGNTALHAVLWPTRNKIVDLGTLPGDSDSIAYSVNIQGQVVGSSCRSEFRTCRAFIWQNGAMTDLNTLITPNTGYFLVEASGIADNGDISVDAVNEQKGFSGACLLTPSGNAIVYRNAPRPVALPTALRERFLQRGIRRPFVSSIDRAVRGRPGGQ